MPHPLPVPDAPDSPDAAFVVLAGGSGRRVGADRNKVYLPLAGRHVISWSFAWARAVEQIAVYLLVVRPEDEALAIRVLERDVPGLEVEIVHGGSTRHRSESAALAHLAPRITAGEIGLVALHDGARPLARPPLVRRVLAAARADGGAVPGLPAGSLLLAAPGHRAEPAPRGAGVRLVRMQTPQAFRARELLAAYAAASTAGVEGTDTASTASGFSSLDVRVVPGPAENLKVTYGGDLPLAERLLGGPAR